MGNCRSCEAATAVAASAKSTPTAKLVLQDGELKEFDHPVRSSLVLGKDNDCFVCNADDLEFDGFVTALFSDEELRPGQLYFGLPKSMLRRRLSADEMATLAVRASAALMRCRSRRGSSVAPLVFENSVRGDGGGGGGGRTVAVERKRQHRRAGSSGRGRDFTSGLGAIQESAE